MKPRNLFFLPEVLSRTELSLLAALTILMFLSVLGFSLATTKEYGIVEPAFGGTLIEGVVGKPRFINPLLAQTDADRDLVSLVYSGLLKYDKDGNLEPLLADSYEISEDGLEYTITLKEHLRWSDGETLTVDDIIFTIQLAKNPLVQSPRRANWEGVEAEKISENIIKFHLQRIYVPFLDNLTLGIIPKHLWEGIPPSQFSLAELNTSPVGSGPYVISSIKKDTIGSISRIVLNSNRHYPTGKPYISTVEIKFFDKEAEAVNALKKNLIVSLGSLSPRYIGELDNNKHDIYSMNLQRIIAVFLNKDAKAALGDDKIRQALNAAINKNKLIVDVLSGYGTPIEGPIPNQPSQVKPETYYDPELAMKLIDDNEAEIELTVTTANNEELLEVANFVKEAWDAIGVKTNVKSFDLGDLEQLVIGPRRYDAFIYGEEVIGKNPDLFPFWHSSQRAHPGYNIALYANSKSDKLLELVRTEQDPIKRMEHYQSIQSEIQNDLPAIFLFSPNYIYVTSKNLGGLDTTSINTGSDRFSTINDWYLNKKYIWEIFSN